MSEGLRVSLGKNALRVLHIGQNSAVQLPYGNNSLVSHAQYCYAPRAMGEWVSTEQAAKALAVSQSRIRAMVGDGLLDGEKRGRDLFISALSVSAQRSVYGQLSTAMRIRVFVRDRLTCQECGLYEDDPSLFHVHHKIERSNGGTNDIGNLETLCCDCHKAKHGAKSAEEGRTKPVCFRFSDEVRWAIDDLVRLGYGKDKTEVVSKAILMARDTIAGGSDITNQQFAHAQVVGFPGIVPAREPEKAEEYPFHPRCGHCGDNFGAWNRNASVCGDCKAGHHAGDPRSCPSCGDLGTGGL